MCSYFPPFKEKKCVLEPFTVISILFVFLPSTLNEPKAAVAIKACIKQGR